MTDQRFYDNTRVSTHKSCERRYFYRHEMNLGSEGMPAAPAFGIAWHKACDVIWTRLDEGAITDHDEKVGLIRDAYFAWEEAWTEFGLPSLDEMTPDFADQFKQRTPDTAFEMIAEYIEERQDFLAHDVKLIAVEQPFAVPIKTDDENLWYCGRLDKVIQYKDGIYVVDHKTTSAYKKDGFFKSSWIDSFSPDSQIDGYAYAAHILYGDEFKGIYIDGALVHKTVHNGFCWLPVRRSIDQLDAWLWETQQEIERIEENKGRVADRELGLSYMPGYRKNTGSCFDFNTPCAFLDLCKGYANPADEMMVLGGEAPLGYSIDPWSPFDHSQLDKLGFNREDDKV